jgi:hypothetical protein
MGISTAIQMEIKPYRSFVIFKNSQWFVIRG